MLGPFAKVAAAALALISTAEPSRAAIMITEVIPGVSTSATAGDTVEIFNSGPGAVDLTGWILTDLDDGVIEGNILNEGTFAPGSLAMPPLGEGEFAVVVFVDSDTAAGPSFLATNYGLRIVAPLLNQSFLGDEFEQLLLADNSGTPVDFLAWGSSGGTLTGSNLTDALEDLSSMTGVTGDYGFTPGGAVWAGNDNIADLTDYLASSIDVVGFTGVSGNGNGVIRRLSTAGVFQQTSPRSAADFEVVRRSDATLGNASDAVPTGAGLQPFRITDQLATWVGELNSSTHPDRRISRNEDMVSPDFKTQDGTARTAWEGILAGMLAGDWEATAADAAAINYQVVEFLNTETSDTFYVLRENSIPGDLSFQGQGVYIFDPSPTARERLVLESPHTIFDSGTLEQMGLAIPVLRPRVAFCAGAHRNNSTVTTTCDGTFAGGAPYRISDVAHHPDNFFHTTHRNLNDTFAEMIAIQFHGFCCPGSGSYTTLFDDVVATTGDNAAPGPTDFVTAVADAIEAENYLADDGSPGGDLTTVAVYPVDTNELGATNNLQGRLSNGVPFGNECNTSSPSFTGRFLHLEQDPDVREEPEHIINALEAALSAQESASVGRWNEIAGEE